VERKAKKKPNASICILGSAHVYLANNEDTDSIQRVIRYQIQYKQAGFLADGLSYLPRLPGYPSGINAVFVPEYSNDWYAMDFHHLSF